METRVLSKEDENGAQILKDDQERINLFARLNNKLGDIKDELAALKKQSDNLEDAKSELIMADDGEGAWAVFGGVFVKQFVFHSPCTPRLYRRYQVFDR